MKQLAAQGAPVNADDPIYVQRNPHLTFLLAFGLYASVMVFVDGDPGSRSLDRALGDAAVLSWAAVLALGSALTLVGLFWRGRTWTGLVLERAGLGLVSAGALIFIVAVLLSNPFNEVRYVTALNTAFTAANIVRVWQITRRLRFIRRLTDAVNELARDGHG